MEAEKGNRRKYSVNYIQRYSQRGILKEKRTAKRESEETDDKDAGVECGIGLIRDMDHEKTGHKQTGDEWRQSAGGT